MYIRENKYPQSIQFHCEDKYTRSIQFGRKNKYPQVFNLTNLLNFIPLKKKFFFSMMEVATAFLLEVWYKPLNSDLSCAYFSTIHPFGNLQLYQK